MSDKIMELACKAYNTDPIPVGWYMSEKALEKFAELIVRECMLQCSKVENDDELSNYDGGFKDGAMLCYQQIQEHFGVEE